MERPLKVTPVTQVALLAIKVLIGVRELLGLLVAAEAFCHATTAARITLVVHPLNGCKLVVVVETVAAAARIM